MLSGASVPERSSRKRTQERLVQQHRRGGQRCWLSRLGPFEPRSVLRRPRVVLALVGPGREFAIIASARRRLALADSSPLKVVVVPAHGSHPHILRSLSFNGHSRQCDHQLMVLSNPVQTGGIWWEGSLDRELVICDVGWLITRHLMPCHTRRPVGVAIRRAHGEIMPCTAQERTRCGIGAFLRSRTSDRVPAACAAIVGFSVPRPERSYRGLILLKSSSSCNLSRN
ncbi:hypothetical protein C8Q78DRAFT_368361 [Trametes maxima]|nr:hypothetical protein C8Q78DRAFT_368361 [Trametes maxima]